LYQFSFVVRLDSSVRGVAHQAVIASCHQDAWSIRAKSKR